MRQKQKLPDPLVREPTHPEARLARKVGRFLEDARMGAGLEQAEAALRIHKNWHTMHIMMLECGNSLPTRKGVQSIARVYKISSILLDAMCGRIPISFMRACEWDPELLIKGMRKEAKAASSVRPKKGTKVAFAPTKRQLTTFHKKWRRT